MARYTKHDNKKPEGGLGYKKMGGEALFTLWRGLRVRNAPDAPCAFLTSYLAEVYFVGLRIDLTISV